MTRSKRSATTALLLAAGLSVAGVAWAQGIQSVNDIVYAFQREEIKLADIPARYAELAKTRPARRAAKLAELERQVGSEAFARKDVRDELSRHHRILAMLERARLVAETELEGFRRANTLVRIERLLMREDLRYRASLEKLAGPQAVPP